MITIKSPREIELLRIAGNVVYQTHQYIKPFVKPGITTKELDKLCEDFIISKGCTPSFKGCEGFPCTVCASVNDCVVHGVPSNYKLKEGDIITLDIGACYKGYHGDSGWTYAVGKISKENEYLLEHTEKALYEGIKEAIAGNRIGDIGYAVEKYSTSHNLGVVKEFTGHGIGTSVHEDPSVPNYGEKGRGPLLKPGMVIAIEPMLTYGDEEIEVEENGLTAYTCDGSNAAHYEHTVAITDGEPIILTGEWENGKE
ncbi:MAG: type I methionyl aminopeptidase [Bacilli bacterium]|nr:type I methionyl aminopeptidase [Bacilli bacterium]